MHPETLLPQPILFNAALYAATALLYSSALFCLDNVLADGIFLESSPYRPSFAYISICSWPVLLFGALILIAVRVGANVRRKRRRRRRRRRRRNRSSRSRSRTSRSSSTNTLKLASKSQDNLSTPSLSSRSRSQTPKPPPSTQYHPNHIIHSGAPRRSSSAPPPTTIPLPNLSPPSTRLPSYQPNQQQENYHLQEHEHEQQQQPISQIDQKILQNGSNNNNNNNNNISTTTTTTTKHISSSTTNLLKPQHLSIHDKKAKRHMSDSVTIRTTHISNGNLDPNSSSSRQMRKASSGRSKRSKGNTSSSSAHMVPKGYVSVTRAQKAFAAIGFFWVCSGLIATSIVATLVFIGLRERLLDLAATLNRPVGADEWIKPIFAGLIFVPLFLALAIGVAAKVVFTIKRTPQNLEIRTVSIDDDDDDNDNDDDIHKKPGKSGDQLIGATSMVSPFASTDLSKTNGIVMTVNSDEEMGNLKIVKDSSGLFSDDYIADDDDDDDDDDESDEEDNDYDPDSMINDVENHHHHVETNVPSTAIISANRNSSSRLLNDNLNNNNNDPNISNDNNERMEDWHQLYRRGSHLPFQPDESTVERMMRQLRDMGFPNAHENIAALQASSFDLEIASDKLSNTHAQQQQQQRNSSNTLSTLPLPPSQHINNTTTTTVTPTFPTLSLSPTSLSPSPSSPPPPPPRPPPPRPQSTS